MTYNGEGVEALVSIVDDLQKSSLIMVDKKVQDLLKCLAYYPEFKTVLQECNKNFNLEVEEQKAIREINGRFIFRLPDNKKTMVALVLGLLLQVDNGEFDIISFARECYDAETNQESFNLFCENVIKPFKLAIVEMAATGIEEEPVEVERKIEFASIAIKQQTEYLLSAFVDQVQNATMLDEEREELLIMIEGYAAAIDSRDSFIIRALWIGLKNGLKAHKLCAKEIDQMNETLKMYMVTK